MPDILEDQLQALTEENAMLKKINDALTEQVEALSNASPTQIAEIAKPTVSKETFMVDGKKYGFHPTTPAVLFNGEKITALEVLASTDLQKQLIEAEAGFVQLIS